MPISRALLDARLNTFKDECLRQGIKVTHQRLEIFRVVASTEEHPDAATVHNRVKKTIPTISLDTVYRNLKLLAQYGVLSVVGMSQERVRFDGNKDPHHHFSCVKCGMIRDFISDMQNLQTPGEAQKFGAALSVHLEVKGICTACQRSQRRT